MNYDPETAEHDQYAYDSEVPSALAGNVVLGLFLILIVGLLLEAFL